MDFAMLISPSQPQIVPIVVAPNVATETSPSVDIFVIVISIMIVVVMLALTVYLLFKIPSTIVKTSKKIVFETAEKTAPLILHVQHKKETKKNRLKLTPRLVLIFKVILMLVPLILIFLSKSIENEFISFDLVLIVGVWLAIVCAINFILQYVCGRLLKVKLQDLI